MILKAAADDNQHECRRDYDHQVLSGPDAARMLAMRTVLADSVFRASK